jgi:hypothetical protein
VTELWLSKLQNLHITTNQLENTFHSFKIDINEHKNDRNFHSFKLKPLQIQPLQIETLQIHSFIFNLNIT